MNFQHKIVNDLAWVIGSTPLMSFNSKLNAYHLLDESWFQQELERCHDFLLKQDSDPSLLKSFVHTEGKQLLGKRFEKFVEFWLKYSGRFDIIVSNVQLRHKGQTTGEIDFLVKELNSGNLMHFEVACKYYLGYKNQVNWDSWIGLNAKDTLADKMSKFEKQLSVFNSEAGREFLDLKRTKKPKSYLLMKGFFFYHWRDFKHLKLPKLSNPNHETGLYLKLNECNKFFKANNFWKVLIKQNWFAPFHNSDIHELVNEYQIESEVRELIGNFGSSIMIARLSEHNGIYKENLRIIVVPNHWPNRS